MIVLARMHAYADHPDHPDDRSHDRPPDARGSGRRVHELLRIRICQSHCDRIPPRIRRPGKLDEGFPQRS